MRTDSLLPSLGWLAPRAGHHNAVVRGVPGSSSRPATSVSVENTSCFPWPGFGHVSRLLRREGGPAARGHDDFADVSAGPIHAQPNSRISGQATAARPETNVTFR